jgi:hypothetical protein
MVIKIKDRQVFRNVNQFKQVLIDNRSEFHGKEKERAYQILLDLETGEMQFAKKISGTKTDPHWKSIYLVVREEGGHVHFDLWNIDEKPLKRSDLEKPAAWEIATRTVQTLNNIANKVSRVALSELLPEDQILASEKIELSPSFHVLKNLERWEGSLDRIEAEKKLENRFPGSYLLRELDPLAQATIAKIAEDNKITELQSCIMTFVERDRKICEVILIGISENQWTFYQDNVDLHSPKYTYYPSAEFLIHRVVHGGLSADT